MNKFHTPDDVLSFWFSEKVKPLWFKQDPEFDQEISQRFFDAYQLASAGKLDNWHQNPGSILALIILLDQFPRNMFRHNAQAFATDRQAVELTQYALAKNYEQELSTEKKVFLYMPLMHSEDFEHQTRSVELFQQLGKENNLKFAIKHQEIVARFGRFPHRNNILGRESTSAEKEFLTQPGSTFG